MMCGQSYDDPTTYGTASDEVPFISRPRRYVLSGGKQPRPSVALAVLGSMLTDAEAIEREQVGAAPTTVALQRAVVATLRVARERVAAAESHKPVVGGFSTIPGPTDAELRAETRADRELMRDEMNGRDIDGSIRW